MHHQRRERRPILHALYPGGISRFCRAAILMKKNEMHARVGQGEFPGHFCRVVRRAVVNDKHLQRRRCLIQSRANRSMQEGARIVGSDKNRDAIVCTRMIGSRQPLGHGTSNLSNRFLTREYNSFIATLDRHGPHTVLASIVAGPV
jgi:hypothetical protein